MQITTPIARTNAVDPNDVRIIKAALNRLGYYIPDPYIGMNDLPDDQLFHAIANFQKKHGFEPTGILKPGDQALEAIEQARIDASRRDQYIWRTMLDNRVRPHHQAREGLIFFWDNPPDDGHPGEADWCRCKAVDIEETPDDDLNTWNPANQWQFGSFKSTTKWQNQMIKREWTIEEITETIRYGTPYPAPNKVNNTHTATRYEYNDKFVVVDDQTKEVLQVSGTVNFKANETTIYGNLK